MKRREVMLAPDVENHAQTCPKPSPPTGPRAQAPTTAETTLLPAIMQIAQAVAEGLTRAAAHEPAGASPHADGDRPPLVDLKEAARMLRVSRMTVARLCDQGRIPCVVVAEGARQKLRRVPRAFIDSVVSEALSVAGQVDMADYAVKWLSCRAKHAEAGSGQT